METNKLIKLAAFNAGLAVIEIVLFSEGLVGLRPGSESILESAAAITIILMSIIIFLYVNYKLLSSKTPGHQVKMHMDELDEPAEFISALNHYVGKQMFRNDIITGQDQVRRLENKMKTLDTVLFQNFREGTENYSGFQRVVTDAQKMIYDNLKKVINAMEIIDPVEYNRVMGRQQWSQAPEAEGTVLESKRNMYRSHLIYIQKLLEKNEEILLEFDKLLMEASRLSDEDDSDTLADIRDVIGAMQKLHERPDKEFEELEARYMNMN